MRRTILFLCTAIILFSCGKIYEDHLIGEWRLDATYKKELLGRDYFQTGYEDGFFTFYESGTATYITGQDTLSGYWKSNFYTRWNNNNDDDDGDRLKYLEVYVADYSRNRVINWKFDNFIYKDSWKRIRAVEYTLGKDRYYEFVKH